MNLKESLLKLSVDIGRFVASMVDSFRNGGFELRRPARVRVRVTEDPRRIFLYNRRPGRPW